ncbi:MAG: hypothetical protein IPM48_06405 [Saprospiraceae bacterium]|nr:hypothetical protein [Saprospiraceae bacterium]
MIEILQVQALRGPNIFSLDHRLIVMRVKFDEKTAASIFELKNIMTQKFGIDLSLSSYPHLMIARIALELQKKVAYQLSYFNGLETNQKDVWRILFEYHSEQAGRLAAHATVKMLNDLLLHGNTNPDDALTELQNIKNNEPEPSLSIQESLNPNRKPIIAVTGTNGKTTTSRLIAHICQEAGYCTGFTTSDGIYINGQIIETGDTTGPASAAEVLRHPDVELAVLETARGGILRAGLGFAECQIAVVTNVQSDHLGLGDIHTIEEMAKVKGLIVEVLQAGGAAILNLENEHTKKMSSQSDLRYGWFSILPQPKMPSNCNWLAFVENKSIVVKTRDSIVFQLGLDQVPISYHGTVPFMIENAMAAILACLAFGISTEKIKNAVSSFYPSAEQTPGRLNIFDFHRFRVMIDFAHNPDGFAGVKEFLNHIDAPQKIGIITGTGDRPDESIVKLGILSAEMFDHIIVHQAKFHRGRLRDDIVHLLIKGILQSKPNASYEFIEDEIEPLAYAISKAQDGAFITALSDVLDNPIQLIKSYQENSTLNPV